VLVNINGDNLICFEVTNFRQIADINPDTEDALEDALSVGGATVARLDWPSNTLCVYRTDPTVTSNDILQIITSFGYRARLKGD
jgi:hypothetical protein